MDERKKALRGLSKAYGLSLVELNRIAELHDYDMNVIIDKLDELADSKIESSLGLYTQSWEDFQINQGLWD